MPAFVHDARFSSRCVAGRSGFAVPMTACPPCSPFRHSSSSAIVIALFVHCLGSQPIPLPVASGPAALPAAAFSSAACLRSSSSRACSADRLRSSSNRACSAASRSRSLVRAGLSPQRLAWRLVLAKRSLTEPQPRPGPARRNRRSATRPTKQPGWPPEFS